MAQKLPETVDVCAESWSTEDFNKVDPHKMSKTNFKWKLIWWKL